MDFPSLRLQVPETGLHFSLEIDLITKQFIGVYP